jgi:hypothetical protein
MLRIESSRINWMNSRLVGRYRRRRCTGANLAIFVGRGGDGKKAKGLATRLGPAFTAIVLAMLCDNEVNEVGNERRCFSNQARRVTLKS